MKIILNKNDSNVPQRRLAAMSGEMHDSNKTDGMSNLSRGARLLIWTMRQFIATSGHTTLIAREFAAACGNDASSVFATFGTFLCMLAYSGRRRLRIGLPGDSGLTEDERLLVNMIAAFQNDNRVLADFYMGRFSRRATRHELRMAIGALATAFASNGLLFPVSRSFRAA
jgi:hypothetical protein